MSNDEIIRAIIAEQFDIQPKFVCDNETFDQMGADSLDLIEIAMTAEDEFVIDIPDEVLPKEGATTVSEFIAIVAQRIMEAA